MKNEWVKICNIGEINLEDVIRFDYKNNTYAIYRSQDDEYFATDGLCTHGKVHLADGFVMGNVIECPKHNGKFDYTNGKAKSYPAITNLNTYNVKIDNNSVYIYLDELDD